MVCQAKSVGPSNEAAILNVQDEILEVDDIQDFDSDKEQGAEKSSYMKQTSLTPGLEHQLSQKENIDSTNDKTTRNDNNKIIIIDDSD